MSYINILNCNSDISSCCNDAGLAALLNIVRRVVELFQIIVPILLLAMLTFQLVKLVINPDEKNGFKKITNRILAAVIIFFIPVFLNILMNLAMETESFQLAACWNEAKNEIEYQNSTKRHFIEGPNVLNNALNGYYGNNANGDFGVGSGSDLGKNIINYALTFKNVEHKINSTFTQIEITNGEKNIIADNVLFVYSVFDNFGITLKSPSKMWKDTDSYELVDSNDIKAGDLVAYSNFFGGVDAIGILTGNGNQMIYATQAKGVIHENDYRTVGNVKGIMRMKALSESGGTFGGR